MDSPDAVLASLSHPVLGACDLVRIEGTNWVVRTRADQREHRVPPGARGRFKRLYEATSSLRPATSTSASPPSPSHRTVTVLAVVEHPSYGVGDVVRVEVTDWIIRFKNRRGEIRWPAKIRSRLRVLEDRTAEGRFRGPGQTVLATPTAPIDATSRSSVIAAVVPDHLSLDRRLALRAIESLRIGLPPPAASGLRAEFGTTGQTINSFLDGVRDDGGRALVIRGGYGHGKTFTLRQAEELALASGFAVLRTEIDAGEIRLNRPNQVYHDLLAHLRLPDAPSGGAAAVRHLVRRAAEWIDQSASGSRRVVERRKHLAALQCEPLIWLLSDPDVADKLPLVELLSAAPSVDTSAARSLHVTRGRTQDWPSFSASTQGDFASYLLCGLGRLCKEIGYRGLLVVLDEMERWQDLNWQQQTLAGNLLGGLIWGATASSGARTEQHEPPVLTHSHRGGGFPFTTLDRCHLGVLIAMTPRGEDGPENAWQHYGPVLIHDLPSPTNEGMTDFFARVLPLFCSVHETDVPSPADTKKLSESSIARWRHAVEPTMRAGVAAVIATLENWAGNQVEGEP